MTKISYLIKAALVLVACKVILFAIKIIFGLLINSLALIADAINSGADFIVAIGIIVGIKLSERSPSPKFPYGLHKIENLIELFIALGIFYAGYTILTQAIVTFNTSTIYNPDLGLFITGISIAISVLLMYYLNRIGKKTNSPLLLAEAKDSKVDILSITLVFVGITGYYLGFSMLESIVSIVVAFFIFKVGVDIFIHSSKVLLDAVMNYDKLNRIRQLIEAHPNVLAVKRLNARSAGRFCYLEIELETSLKSLNKAHELTETLETEIQTAYPDISRINIHIEPKKKEITRYAIPLQENKGFKSTISPHFGSASNFIMFDAKGNQIHNLKIFSNPFLDQEKQKGIAVANWLANNSVDKILVKEPLKGGALLAIEKNLIEIELNESSTIEEIFNRFFKIS